MTFFAVLARVRISVTATMLVIALDDAQAVVFRVPSLRFQVDIF
jgi:hypothetical protein